MEYSKNKFAKFEYNADNEILYWHWQPKTEDAKWEELKPDMIQYAEVAEKYNAKYHLVDEREMKFVYIPDIQTWMDNNISPRTLTSGVEKFALIKSKDIFIETAVQQIFDEENSKKILMKLFDEISEAEKWLLEK